VTRRLALPILVAATLAAGACGDDPATPTSASVPDESLDTATRLFAGTLSPRGAAFYSFTMPQDSEVSLTLASVAPTSGRGAIATPLTLGLGVPRGTGCAVTTLAVVAADLAAQIRESRTAGVHCASLADTGNLAGDIAFAVRIGYLQ
jgi:hypothetical protein